MSSLLGIVLWGAGCDAVDGFLHSPVLGFSDSDLFFESGDEGARGLVDVPLDHREDRFPRQDWFVPGSSGVEGEGILGNGKERVNSRYVSSSKGWERKGG